MQPYGSLMEICIVVPDTQIFVIAQVDHILTIEELHRGHITAFTKVELKSHKWTTVLEWIGLCLCWPVL